MVPAPAHRAAWQKACSELLFAHRAPSANLDEGFPLPEVPVDRKNRLGLRLYVDHVIVLAPILVGAVERSPSRGERETAVVAREVAQVSHGPSMAQAIANPG